MIPEKIKVKIPADLTERLSVSDLFKLERVELLRIPVLNAEISVWERLIFFARKVFPFLWEIAVYYLPIPPIVKQSILSHNTEVPMDSKPFWQSKTFWSNILFAGVALFGFDPDSLSPEFVAGFFALLNILLRFITKKEVKVK